MPVGGSASTARLVGRDSAVADLDRHLTAALGNRRQVVFVVGEPGIGKTSVVDRFQRQATGNAQLRAARGQCVEGFGSKEPYYPVLEALGQLVREMASRPIAEALATHAPTWMIQFRSLVRDDQRATLHREMLGATRERMVRELCEALEVITQTIPLILVLEDLHWADHSTLDLVSAIARRREPAKLLLLATFRPGDVIMSDSPLKALSNDLKLHRLSHEVALERLTESDVADYLVPAFAPARLPEGFARVIHRHSDGNPLFMTAMLDHLEQQGVLAREDGRWTLTVPLQEVDPGVPETLRQMLEMQLEHLTDTERRLLECASVAGQHFTAWAVTRMLGRDPAAVEEQCQALAEGQFIKLAGVRTLDGGALTLGYEFKHALYREVLYRRLSPTERVNFHRRLGEGLEGLHVPVRPEGAAEIAAHFEEGRNFERAVRYLMLAAENATNRHAYLESIGILEHAREVLEKVPGREQRLLESQILERIGDAHYTVGDVERSLETYDGMAANAARASLPIAEATALMRLAHPAAFVDSERCVAGCERAVRIAASINDRVLETHARLLASCWRIMIDGWRTEEAEACATSMAILRRMGAELPPYDQILYARVQIFGTAYAEACESAEGALLKLTEAHALWIRAKALSTKANALLFAGQLGDAHRTVAAGIELANKNENAPWLGILLSTLAWLHWETFDFPGLEALWNEVEQSAAASSGPRLWQRATANVAGGTMRILQGFADAQAGHHDRALRQFAEIRDRKPHPKFGLAWQRRMLAQLGLGEVWLARAEWTRATTEADALVSDATECGDGYLKARAWDLRARLALASAGPDAAQPYVQRALEIVTTFDLPLAAWRVHATAFEVYQHTNRAKADVHRSNAESIVLGLASSLAEVAPLRQSLLSAEPVRRLLEAKPNGNLHETFTSPLVQQS
jgi:tetratricopeptide (TPR) repeat protein